MGKDPQVTPPPALAPTRRPTVLTRPPQIASFDGTHVTVRRSDGALLSSAVSPYPIALYGMVIKSMWEQAIQLCR